MATWSGTRKKLEDDYLAESLKGHIQYFATSYSRSPDHEGRAAIRYNGKEILQGNYYNVWFKRFEFPRDEKFERRLEEDFAFIDGDALELGVFDQRCFYQAFDEFDNQSIENSLASENELVKIFAILDRRIGKRRLISMKDSIRNESKVFQEFYAIRMMEEGISSNV